MSLVGWLLVTFVAAALGAFASTSAATFYAALDRPPWAPPAWLFGPVWSGLYLLMGFAAWLAWRERRQSGLGSAHALYLAQLAANALWTWLFFVWHSGAAAFAEILVLIALIGATMVAFRRLHRVASLMLVPYLVWVCFAAGLTWSTWQRNPGVL